MILESVERQLLKAQTKKEGVFPAYSDYCMPNAFSTLAPLLGGRISGPRIPLDAYKEHVDLDGIRKIAFIFIDGLGYDKWKRSAKEHAFFKGITDKGAVAPVTTVFPSTTAAALTSLHTNSTPQEHAMIEWVLYMKELNKSINTLPFSNLGDKGRDTLLAEGVHPNVLFTGESVFPELLDAGVSTVHITPRDIASGAYASRAYASCETVAYKAHSDMAVGLRKALTSEKKGLFYTYIPFIDSVEHAYGPDSEECEAELSLLSHILQREFVKKVDAKTAKETLVVITADHGQVELGKWFDISGEKFRKARGTFKEIGGKMVEPYGSQRDLFLQVKDGMIDEAEAALEGVFHGGASIMRTQDAYRRGLFGRGEPSDKFWERAGDVIVLPKPPNGIRFPWMPTGKQVYKGYHGGLTREEMLVPFAMARLSELA